MRETVAAIITPHGAGAVAAVRLSGPAALAIADRVFSPVNEERGVRALKGYAAAYGHLRDAGGALIDEAVAIVYRAPRSYTGEDVAELCCHGGVYAAGRALRACLDAGAVPAAPGEFTRRAYENGKLDLAQAEAVMELVGAQGDAALRAALASRQGALGRETRRLGERLLAQSAHLAAWSDYPDEDLIPVERGALTAALREIEAGVSALLATYDTGRLVRDGVTAVIVGKPNVGKSSLMNLLAGCERSIVTAKPGTTRDVVEEDIRLGGLVLRLADTAGLREGKGEAERLGVARALARLEEADIVLAVFDGSRPADGEDAALLARLEGRPCVAAVNKADLPQRFDMEPLRRRVAHAVSVSARTGAGREALEEAILRALALDKLDATGAVVANERQRACLRDAKESLCEAVFALEQGVTLDAVGVCAESALASLLALTGEGVTGELVDAVFARFCVGK